MPQHLHTSSVTKGTQASLDEFKYGFPTGGLGVVSYKWWGSSSSDCNEEKSRKKRGEDLHEDKKKTEELADDGADTLLNDGEMADDGADTLLNDGEKPNSGNDESNINPQGTGLLLCVRKNAAEDGQKALRLGVHQGYDISVLGRRERNLFRRIFSSSLPSHWRYESTES